MQTNENPTTHEVGFFAEERRFMGRKPWVVVYYFEPEPQGQRAKVVSEHSTERAAKSAIRKVVG